MNFFDIKPGPYDLPAPPNGTWWLPVNGAFTFGLYGPIFSFSYRILTGGIWHGYAAFNCGLIIPDTHVFDALVAPGGDFDLFRGNNAITDPNEAYYGGYSTILPVFESDLPDDVASIVAAVGMNGPSRVNAELMGAATDKRAVRLARKYDHSCCHFVLTPVTSIV